MARISVDGLDGLLADLGELAALPDRVVEDMLNAEAEVIVRAQQAETASQWRGEFATGTTARSIRKGRLKKTADGRSLTVAPQGKNARGTRNAEVAFINEFGKRGQPARPAIAAANARAEQEAVDAAEKQLNAFLDSKKL